MNTLFKKVRFYKRLFVAFWDKHKKTILLSFIIGIVIASSLPIIVYLFLEKEISRIGIVGKYSINNLPLEIEKEISQGLTSTDETGAIKKALASSWQIKENGKIYQFKLKKGLFWHDGTPVTTEDFDYNFSDVAVDKIDDLTLKFELKEAYAPFLTVVSEPVFKKGLIGAGELKVKSIVRNGQIVERLSLISREGRKKQLIYKFYPTETAARTAFKLGEVDILNGLNQANELKNWPNIKIEKKVNQSQLAVLVFKIDQGYFSEKFFRQALAYAINKDFPNRALGPISPDSWAYNPNLKEYEYDLEKSRILLNKGFENLDQQIKIELTTFYHLYSLAEKIKTDWEVLGIETQIKVVDSIPAEFEALLVIEDTPPDPDQYLLWHSTQQTNLSRLKSPQIDRLLEEGRKTLKKEERVEIYQDFQRFLVEEAPVVFLYHPATYTIMRMD